MKKTLKIVSKTVIVLMLLLAIDLSLVVNFAQAESIEKQNIHQIDYCDKVLVYNGIPRGAAYVVYGEGEKQRPAYCVNPERDGVGETEAYDVTVQGNLENVMLWRIITNGYPYKTLGELGVETEKETYLATKQAIYCLLDNRDVYSYSGIGDSGKRTLNALRQIWEDAHNSSETKISNIVNIISMNEEWKQDPINKNYVSKNYKIEAPAPITQFNVEIKGDRLPEGLIVTDINNNARTTFNQNDEFKILIPVNILRNNGSFQINVKTQMKTKPVLYGSSQDENLQNYALTTFSYEDSTGTYYEDYQKNESKIKILKREKETKDPLQGVEFELLDSNKNAIYQSLITDKNGEILLEGIQPGVYYLKEIKTLPGYILYDELIKIEIHLNEQVNVIINNSKENKTEISKEITNIEVEKTTKSLKEDIKETEITKKLEKLPKTGM